jgi:hypothetical protein
MVEVITDFIGVGSRKKPRGAVWCAMTPQVLFDFCVHSIPQKISPAQYPETGKPWALNSKDGSPSSTLKQIGY